MINIFEHFHTIPYHTIPYNTIPYHTISYHTISYHHIMSHITSHITDEHLTWTCHINKISNKISQCMCILNRLKCFLPIQTKVLIYNSPILSHLNFGILLWGFKCHIVFKLQKQIIRILSLSKYNAHTDAFSNN